LDFPDHDFGVAMPRFTASRSPIAVSQRFTEAVFSRIGPSAGLR
jgi:hypothetical protein